LALLCELLNFNGFFFLYRLVETCKGDIKIGNDIIKRELDRIRDACTKAAKEKLNDLGKPYMEQDRDRFDGPARIGKSLDLREDFYSSSYLNCFKLEYITGKPNPNQKEEPDSNLQATGQSKAHQGSEEAGPSEAFQAT